MDKTISILGCGWLGLPLAKQLIDKGWHVKGSSTSKEKLIHLQKVGIKPYLIDVSKKDTLNPDFFASNYIVVNIPPSKVMRDAQQYLGLISCIEHGLTSKVVFVSSTSVYPANNAVVDESYCDDMADGENAILDIERIFQKAQFETTIIRFGGLVGGVRYPGRFFSPDRVVKGGNHPVNIIHLDDCIQMIESVLHKNVFGEVFNGVADTHPTKSEFYSLAAKLKGNAAPTFSNEQLPYKIISNEKLKSVLGLRLKHPDLLQMLKNSDLWQ